MAFASKPLFAHIDNLGTDNAHGELYLTDMAEILVKAGERVLALEAKDPDEVLGANTIAEMMAIDEQAAAHDCAPANGRRSDDFSARRLP